VCIDIHTFLLCCFLFHAAIAHPVDVLKDVLVLDLRGCVGVCGCVFGRVGGSVDCVVGGPLEGGCVCVCVCVNVDEEA
jgi:hypothetical protein